MRSSLRLDVKEILDFFVILFAWLGAFGHFISANFGGMAYVLFAYALLAMEILLERNQAADLKVIYLKSAGLLLAFCILYFFLASFFETSNSDVSIFTLPVTAYNLLISIPVWFACYLLLLKNNEQRDKQAVKLLFLILFYNTAITVMALIFIPDYSRNSAAAIMTEKMSVFAALGAMGYELTYSIAVLVPAFLFTARLNRNKGWLLLGLLGIIFIIKSQFVIGIIALLLNVFLSWALARKNLVLRIGLVIILVAIGILVVINSSKIGVLLIELGSSMTQNAVSSRILEIGEFFKTGNVSGDIQIRLNLIQNSIHGISQHFVLGNMLFEPNYQLSGHSTLLDLWDGYGLLPLLLFISAILNAYRYVAAVIDDRQKLHVLRAAYITFFFIALLNPVLAAPQIVLTVIFVLPLLAVGRWKKERA